MIEKLAKILKANLEIQEKGMLNFRIYVHCEDGFSQIVGGIILDEFSEDKDKRIGAAYGCEIIRRLLIELKVNDFSEMKGKKIFVIGEGEKDGLPFKPLGIRSLKVDNKDAKSVIFDEILQEMKGE